MVLSVTSEKSWHLREGEISEGLLWGAEASSTVQDATLGGDWDCREGDRSHCCRGQI